MFKKLGFSSCYPVLKAFFQWIILVLAKGGRDSMGPPRRQCIPGIYAVYTANRVIISINFSGCHAVGTLKFFQRTLGFISLPEGILTKHLHGL